MTSTKKAASAALALALGAGALASASLAGTAHAATGNTAAIHGETYNSDSTLGGLGKVWYDASGNPPGSKPAVNPGPNRTVSLTAVANGADIDVVIALSAGPQNSFQPLAAGAHSLDALVRLDGKSTLSRFQGPIGAATVPGFGVPFADGATITGKIPRAGLGAHSVSLASLVLNINGSAPDYSSGQNLADEYKGYDTIYNGSPTSSTTPVDWAGITESVNVTVAPTADTVKPSVKITKPSKKKAQKGKNWTTVRGSISDALSGPKDVKVELASKSGKDWKFFNGKKYKNAKNKKQALKKAKTLTAIPGLNGNWQVTPNAAAPKGKLWITAVGSDKDGNTSTKKLKQTIKK